MNDNPRLPYGYEDNVTCTTDKTGRMAINWPEGCRGTVISRELLDAIVEEKNNCHRWIPVEERLPSMGKEVLVTADGWMRIAYWGLSGWAMTGMGRLDTTKPPSHWMPLPWDAPRTEPPEVK